MFYSKHFKEMLRKRKSTGGAVPSTQAKKAKKRLTAQDKLTLQNSETQETKQPREGILPFQTIHC